jgi:hypothetical protein
MSGVLNTKSQLSGEDASIVKNNAKITKPTTSPEATMPLKMQSEVHGFQMFVVIG